MDFNEYPACRTSRHFNKGIPATHRISDGPYDITFYCWECVYKNRKRLSNYTITTIKPYDLYVRNTQHD